MITSAGCLTMCGIAAKASPRYFPCVDLEQERAEVERVAVSWQDVPEAEQEAMLAGFGKMLEYLDTSDDGEYQLSLDVKRLMQQIEAGLGRTAAPAGS